MSEVKTAQQIDEMTSAEYAKYIKYSAPATEVPVAEVPEVPEDDPTMAPAPVAVVPEPPPAPVEKRFEYQSVDEQNRPIGGKQVIVYTDEEDLKRKYAAKEQNLVRQLREVTRKQRLGIVDGVAPIPQDAEFSNIPEFAPRELSAEERFQLSQDINDPAKSVDAVNTLIEASVGMSSQKLRDTLGATQLLTLQLTAKANYDIFERSAADFYPCADNKQVLTDWMFKNGLAPTVKNFKLAQSTLSEAGLLVDSPIVREVPPAAPVVAPSTEPNSQVPAVPESRIVPVEQPQTKRQVPVSSGLSESNSSSSSSPATPSVISATLADIENMSAEKYKKWLKDPANKDIIAEMNKPRR